MVDMSQDDGQDPPIFLKKEIALQLLVNSALTHIKSAMVPSLRAVEDSMQRHIQSLQAMQPRHKIILRVPSGYTDSFWTS